MKLCEKWVGGCAIALAVLGIAATLPAQDKKDAAGKDETSAAETAKPDAQPLTLAEARQRGRLMHRIYEATLESMHRHYFHGDRSIVPARAMEDIFSELDRHDKIQARWIAVNTKAMSIDHEPESDFEKEAAGQIAEGKQEVERIEKGVYQRAGAIPLAGGCVGCHMGTFGPPPKKPRFAGLVISIPIREE
jgi:hypothetical protein